MENSKVMSEATCFDSRIDFRIANPDVFRTAMQLPLNGTAYSAHRGMLVKNNDQINSLIKESLNSVFKDKIEGFDIENIKFDITEMFDSHE